MKPNKISTLLLAATACGVAWASVGGFTNSLRKKAADNEKVRPAQSLTETAPVSRAAYTPLKAEGNNGVPYGLKSTGVSDRAVSLQWISPEATDGYFEDFESHEDFEINSAGSIGWSYIDADNQNTYTWQACAFPNQGQKMAFIVMNPWATSPAVNENPDYVPHSGKKMLVDFCAVDAQNNDYIISPELAFDSDFQVSFYARSYKVGDNFNPERIRVGYSTTGKRPSDFTYVNDGPYVELPAEWTLVKYTIPKNAKYVTINCVSDDAFMLLIDDIFIGTNRVRPASAAAARAAAKNPVVGFNVYRDGQKVTSEPVDAVSFTDNVPEYGDYTYTVTAVQQDGTESAQSEALTVNVPDTRMLPFEDAFDDWTLHEDKWTEVSHDGYDESQWSIDYYEYGLVDPAATYKWSSRTNYNESLMTRELHTADRANTWLRFQLRLRNSEHNTVDYLSAEVSSDGGQTWKELQTFDNSNGSFEWTTFQYNLSDVLDSDLFRVRFRAHGADAKWINYWYVDDVKIWNPVWTSGKLSVASDAEGSIAGCDVTLTADHGAVVKATTDQNGTISLDQLEAGRYDVSVAKEGYNVYKGEWNVDADAANTFSVRLTKPSASLSASSLVADLAAEDSAVKKFSLTNTGDGQLVWHLRDASAKGSGDDSNRWEIQPSFSASSDLQQSVAFDGEFYYTTSSIELGKFWKYDRDGKFIEQFSIPEMYYALYDITYDGRYFYGSDNSNRIFKLDFDNRRIAGIITIADEPSLKITHCSYDPDRNGFWVGGFTTIGFVDMTGRVRSRFTSISTSESVAVYGSAYDNVSPGGPYLWLSDMTSESSDQIDKVQIRQFSTTKRALTAVKHSLTDAPGYVMGNQNSGENYVCGIFASTDVMPGKLTLMGTLNQMPNLIFRYTLCETDKWLSISPKHGTLAPGATQEFTVGFDALQARQGDKWTTDALIQTNPEMDDLPVSFALNATSESATPRPQSVEAKAATASAMLAWQNGNGTATPDGYNVYRNGRRVNAEPVKEMSFTDRQLVYGEYIYKVSAVYGSKESRLSDSVKVFVTDGAQYYAPVALKSAIDGNKNVSLSWQSPLAGAADDATMSWCNGKHEDDLGLADGGIFYVGAMWDADDIVPYRNKRVRSVGVQIVNPVSYLALMIQKDGETIYKQQYKGDLKYDGTLSEIPVEEDIVLEPGHKYVFGFQIMNDAGVQPIGIDDGKAVSGKGNLLSYDGTTWHSASISGIEGNFNIRVNLAAAASDEQQPVGYNVYRDGVKVNESLVTEQKFDDVLDNTGVYSYTVTSVYADGGESAMSEAVKVEAYEIADRTAPHDINATIDGNRIVSLRWDNPTVGGQQTFRADLTRRPVTVASGCPEFVNSFRGPKSGMAVASDGTFIYTSIYNEDGRIEKYDLQGNKIGSYKIDGIDGIRNLAFDGEYLYAADNTTYIHRINPATMENLEDISISEYSRHTAFVPTLDDGNGGFEVGDWETSIYVAKNGGKLGTGPTLKGASGTAYYDGKLYAFEQGNDANKYTIGIYDFQTGDRIGSIDMGQYGEISDMASVSAGGMSSFTSKEGITYLLLSLQRQGQETEFVILDLGGLTTVAGYNVLRNGEKRNAELLTRRYFEETETAEGTYDYTVQTVYINGETSEPSHAVKATIFPTGTAKAPASVQAKQSTYGYNVLLSFADPDMHQNAASVNGFETDGEGDVVYAVSGESYKSGWTATSAEAFEGSMSMHAAKGEAAFGVIPAEGMKYLRLAARNADDHDGNGSISFYYSTGGTDRENFIRLESVATSESWQDVLCELPAGTEYVAVAKDAAQPAQYIDDVALYNDAPQSNLYGFDIYRNGTKINSQPVSDIAYVDHNLLPGKYEYEVTLTTKTAAVSEKSAPVSLDLYYDNGSLAPTNLRVSQTDEGNRLSWQFPALGEPVYLRWHDGYNYDAGGLSNGGAFFAGAKWFASDLKGYGSLALSDVEVYINQIPEAMFLLVYENNTLVRQQFVPTLKQYSFNTIHLDEPLPVDESKDLRVAVYIEHNEITVPLGYDRGPARSGRGDLYSSDGVTWSTMEDSGSSVDANWNISIGLSPYSNSLPGTQAKAPRKALQFVPKRTAAGSAFRTVSAKTATPSEKNVFGGYNVYRNGDRINSAVTTDTTFVDASPADAKYLSYQVSAVYTVAGEKFSDKVTVVATGIGSVSGENGVKVKTEGSSLVITGARAGDRITLYTADGKQLASVVAADAYSQSLDISSVTAGVYVVKVGRDTFKLSVSRK